MQRNNQKKGRMLNRKSAYNEALDNTQGGRKEPTPKDCLLNTPTVGTWIPLQPTHTSYKISKCNQKF